jgi:hypothetical protein
MDIKIFTLLLLATCSAHAEISERNIEADCQNKIKKFILNGDKFYKLKQYSKARQEYEQQVGWSESCALNEASIAAGYNNVALTYIHQKEYLKARAWLNLSPKDAKSIFNLNHIKDDIQNAIVKSSKIPNGEYWMYAGKSIWNVIAIKKENTNYRFDFTGYYAGLMTMHYGPNIGEFSTVLAIKNGRAHYSMTDDNEYSNCVYDFVIKKDTLSVELVTGNSCGYGHNVSAEGIYQKVL